jgi:putative ABC transport system ATP-binding protein
LPTIELLGITKSYQEGDRRHVVLEGVDLRVEQGELIVLLGKSGSGKSTLRVEQGELIVLLGKSGSGKSTLLNLLAGIDRPDAGRVVIAGTNLTGLGERDRTIFRRRHIGFIFQFFNLLPTLTVVENLLLPLELEGAVGQKETRSCLEMLSAVGLADRADSFPDRLSGGERQRVAVARGLVHGPDLILADEPTGNLDVDTGVEVIELLDRLTRQTGRTLFMATHSREVVGVADRVLTVEHGRLVEAEAAG